MADFRAEPCIKTGSGISSAVPTPYPMTQRMPIYKALLAGLLITAAQLFVALAIAPEGGLSDRYHTLVQHDGYWFANIVERGYETILPPFSRKMMEVSNVAFFPAYPALAGALHQWLQLGVYDALLITSQAAAWGFWSYFFLFCARWDVSGLLQFFGALAIVAHPTAFFLVAGYSESLFMMSLFGFMFWSGVPTPAARILAALHGFAMSATRIVGIPCAAFPVIRALLENGWQGLRELRSWGRRYFPPVLVMGAAMLGSISFFLYCFVSWGRWDLYMLTQQAGWAIQPDYLAVFKAESYRWLIPAFKDPTAASQLTMTLGGVIFIVVALCEFFAAIRGGAGWKTRVGLYFCAVVIYYVSVSGVASVQMESMLRYHFCVHALIVLAFLHFLRQLRTPSLPVRALGMGAVALLSVAGLSVQGWYIWNFTRSNWVA
jgi:hypothetical protein